MLASAPLLIGLVAALAALGPLDAGGSAAGDGVACADFAGWAVPQPARRAARIDGSKHNEVVLMAGGRQQAMPMPVFSWLESGRTPADRMRGMRLGDVSFVPLFATAHDGCGVGASRRPWAVNGVNGPMRWALPGAPEPPTDVANHAAIRSIT